jgi:hypothetical protein
MLRKISSAAERRWKAWCARSADQILGRILDKYFAPK